MYVAFLLPPHPPLQSFLSPVLRFFLSSRNLLMVLCRTCEINKFDFKGKHTPPYLYSRQNLNLNEHGTAIPHTFSGNPLRHFPAPRCSSQWRGYGSLPWLFKQFLFSAITACNIYFGWLNS